MTDIFDPKNTPAEENTGARTFDDYVKEVTTKFSKADGSIDHDAVLRAKAESNRFIETLLREKQEMRREMEKLSTTSMTMENFLQKLERDTSKVVQPDDKERSPELNKPTTEAPSKESLQDLVRQALEAESSKKQREQNLAASVKELTKIYGDDYQAHLVRRAEELKVSKEFLNKLAVESPEALVAVVAPDQGKGSPSSYAPPRSVFNTSDVQKGNERDFYYYESIRKKNPREYWTAKVQQELYEDYKRLGDKFKKP